MKINKLKALQKDLNNFKYKCKNGCFECCTKIIFLKEELILMKKELIKNWFKKPPNWKWNNYCEYLTKDWKCSVYNARPIICRTFSDISFLLKNKDKKYLTNICTYSKKRKVVVPSNEYLSYSKELMEKWISNK